MILKVTISRQQMVCRRRWLRHAWISRIYFQNVFRRVKVIIMKERHLMNRKVRVFDIWLMAAFKNEQERKALKKKLSRDNRNIQKWKIDVISKIQTITMSLNFIFEIVSYLIMTEASRNLGSFTRNNTKNRNFFYTFNANIPN